MIGNDILYANISHDAPNVPKLKLSCSIYEYGIVRCTINEIEDCGRFRSAVFGPVIIDSLVKKLPLDISTSANTVRVSIKSAYNESALSGLRTKINEAHFYAIEMDLRPFRLRYLVDGQVQAIVNEKQLLNYESSNKCPRNTTSQFFDTFEQFSDSIPFGPTSVALDFTFPESKGMYGLPLHTTPFKLSETKNGDPYRFFNTDVSGYPVDNRGALYGNIPYILSQTSNGYTEMLWVNTADTWIDITSSHTKMAHWASEAGIIEFFFFSGQTIETIVAKLHVVSGKAPMPLYSAIGYHQCRHTYLNQQDLMDVATGLDTHKIPYDSLWLDIFHTVRNFYFTWDLAKFPTPSTIFAHLKEKLRFLVTIVDPHIGVDNTYFVSKKINEQQELMVRTNKMQPYVGNCWPGPSNYIDFLNIRAKEYWMEQMINYPNTDVNHFIWNDMNEPSVFDAFEVTMPKSNLHTTGTGEVYEHREVHNMYGFLTQRATFEALKKKNPNIRPFVLSRSFFLGSQRLGTTWTGDTRAEWPYLRASLAMLLGVSIGGFSYLGTDIGGFLGNPSEEMLIRWYQLGTFSPFFRAHSDFYARRREPWLYKASTLKVIKEAIEMKYILLPYFYTLFYEHAIFGTPILRPLIYNYNNVPEEVIDKQGLVGPDIMIIPVVSESNELNVYIPPEDLWYSYYDYSKGKTGKLLVTLDKIGIYIRGGSILPRFHGVKESAEIMRRTENYTLTVSLSQANTAEGYLYLDDGVSWNFNTSAQYILKRMQYKNNVLTIKNLHQGWTCENYLQTIVVAGAASRVKTVRAKEFNSVSEIELNVTKNELGVIEIETSTLRIAKEYEIRLTF